MTKEEFLQLKVGDVVYCNYDFSKAYFGHNTYGYIKGFYTVVEKDGEGRSLESIKQEHLGYIPCVDRYERLSVIPYCFCKLKKGVS